MAQIDTLSTIVTLPEAPEELKYALPYKEYILDLQTQIKDLNSRLAASDRALSVCKDSTYMLQRQIDQDNPYLSLATSPYGALVIIVFIIAVAIIFRNRKVEIGIGNKSLKIGEQVNPENKGSNNGGGNDA